MERVIYRKRPAGRYPAQRRAASFEYIHIDADANKSPLMRLEEHLGMRPGTVTIAGAIEAAATVGFLWACCCVGLA